MSYYPDIVEHSMRQAWESRSLSVAEEWMLVLLRSRPQMGQRWAVVKGKELPRVLGAASTAINVDGEVRGD